MKSVEVRRDIAAPAARIWDVLVDSSALMDGDTGIARIEGAIAAGSRFKLWSDVAPGRAFAITVSDFAPPQRMVWRSGMPLGLFRGERAFQLTATTDAQTTLHMREVFSGPLLPLIWRTMPDLQESFDRFARAVAAMAEREPT